jgi:hypothetical protein
MSATTTSRRAAFLGNSSAWTGRSGFRQFLEFRRNRHALANAKNGGVEVDDIRNNQIIGANFMGRGRPGLQVAGFGNFSSRGTSDMILRNANNGGLEVYDINSKPNHWRRLHGRGSAWIGRSWHSVISAAAPVKPI